MKKIITLLVCLGLFLSMNLVTIGQDAISIGVEESSFLSNRAGELECPDNSVFSQPPVNSDNAYFSDESTTWSDQRIYDNFSGLLNPIGGITFWGVLYDGGDCYTGAPDDFVINFYMDNGGNVGALVQSFSVTATPTLTGSFVAGANLLRYDVPLPSNVPLSNGWVMLYRENPENSICAFAWANTNAGDLLTGFNQFGGSIFYQLDDVAFCLNGPSQEIPLNNWAIFLGLFLMISFMAIRYVKSS
jgi:hypothetical protein